MQARNLILKSSLNYAVSNVYNVSCSAVSIQSVRWRKPRWLPMAKSRVFKVSERHVLPVEESEEWKRLNNNYRTCMKSLKSYLRAEVENKKLQAQLAFTPTDEEAEFQRCLEINEKWNADIVKIRDARIAKERSKRFEEIQEKLDEKVNREETRRLRYEDQIIKQKELAPTFITRDNIDKAIEDALSMKVDYNYAIDLEGKIIRSEQEETK